MNVCGFFCGLCVCVCGEQQNHIFFGWRIAYWIIPFTMPMNACVRQLCVCHHRNEISEFAKQNKYQHIIHMRCASACDVRACSFRTRRSTSHRWHLCRRHRAFDSSPSLSCAKTSIYQRINNKLKIYLKSFIWVCAGDACNLAGGLRFAAVSSF